ncbi:hypothetical protein ANO14919_091730 [Xylariales sp. No.14919]|nr:hypothetical protein ANO14919_091730 [Xylariales sp. No.14919]
MHRVAHGDARTTALLAHLFNAKPSRYRNRYGEDQAFHAQGLGRTKRIVRLVTTWTGVDGTSAWATASSGCAAVGSPANFRHVVTLHGTGRNDSSNCVGEHVTAAECVSVHNQAIDPKLLVG